MAKIYDKDDVRYYFQRGDIAFWEAEQVYYDPQTDLYYNRSGDRQRVHEWFKKAWFLGAKFRYYSGDPCYLPEQDPSWKNERRETKKPDRREKISNFVNFVILDTMALCSKTDFNENQTPITSWEKQRDCNFSIKHTDAPNCMYWDPKINGHCGCFEAYDDARGKSVSLDRIESLKKTRTEDVDLEAGIEEIKQFSINDLSHLNRIGELPLVIHGNSAEKNVFYHRALDVYIDGWGNPLRKMTRERRTQNEDYLKFAHNWTGSVEIRKCEGMEPILSPEDQEAINRHEMLHKLHELTRRPTAEFSIPVDNSGTFSPEECNEFNNIISEFVKGDKIWETDISERIMKVAEKCYFDEDDLKQDVGCEFYPTKCSSCTNFFCKYNGFSANIMDMI